MSDLAPVSADHGVVSRMALPDLIRLDRCVQSTYPDRAVFELRGGTVVAHSLHESSAPLGRMSRCRQRTTTRSHPGRTHMTRLTQAVRSFARQDEGQDLLEYALLVALIALVAVGAVTAAGVQVNNIFGQIAGAI